MTRTTSAADVDGSGRRIELQLAQLRFGVAGCTHSDRYIVTGS